MGTLNTFSSKGSFTYTPPIDFLGNATFTYRVSDGNSYSSYATVTLTVTNSAPVAVNDGTYNVTGGMMGGYLPVPSSAGVLVNDSDANGHAMTASLVSQASHGSASLSGNGGFTYTSNMGYTGSDSFTYRVTDGWQYSNTATVTLNITNPLMLAGEELEESSAEALSAEQAQAVLLAAGQSWINAGLSQEAMDDVLASVSIVITDLPGAQLAGVADGVICLDANAAGYGWYVGITDDDFTASGDELTANAGSAAAGQVDLMTALRHEIGHLLGLEHSEEEAGLMNDELGLETRRSVSAADAAIAQWLWEQEQ